MNQGKGADIFTMIENEDTVIFATEHEWRPFDEQQFPLVSTAFILGLFNAPGGIYQVIQSFNPLDYPKRIYKLLRFTANEETGKVEVHIADIAESEAERVIKLYANKQNN